MKGVHNILLATTAINLQLPEEYPTVPTTKKVLLSPQLQIKETIVQ